MGNALVRNVIASIVLVILCIVIGVEAAESAKSSVVIIGALVGLSFLIWIGPRVWTLLYLLPPIIEYLPLPGKFAELPIPFLVGLVVLGYWIVMWGMGYVRIQWRGLLTLDFLVVILAIYMVISYYRHPVSMAIFGYDAEFVGGKEYIWCILAIVYYLAISCIPCSLKQLQVVLKWGVRLTVATCILNIVLSLLGLRAGVSVSQLADAAANTRFGMFVKLGLFGIFYMYGMYPMRRVITSPSLLFGCFLSFCGILISGWREMLMANCFIITALAIVKRELWCLILMGLAVYGALLYLSSEGIVEKFPYGMQRCLSVAPGIVIKKEIRSGTEHSSEWRKEMWRWALDKRTGYIQDYTWGDGFGQSVDYLRRETTAAMRGTLEYGDQDFFARTGTWHSGFITSIHRLGYIGLTIITLIYSYSIVLMFRTCFAWKRTAMFFPAIFFLLPYAAQPSLFYISEGTIIKFFTTFSAIGLIKLMYCVAREQGLIRSFLLPQKYVPQMIREDGV